MFPVIFMNIVKHMVSQKWIKPVLERENSKSVINQPLGFREDEHPVRS